MTEDSEKTDSSTNENIESNDAKPSLLLSVRRSVIGLGLFAIITAGLIAVTQVNTADRIEEQIKQARAKALLEIIPLAEHDNDLLSDSFWLESVQELGLTDPAEAFVAKQDSTPVSLILPVVAPEGYSGPISLIVGIDINGSIKGVRVIKHKETPGLGDKIDIKKSDWIEDFVGKSLNNTTKDAWRVKKDGGSFDQLTGATITPRAIVRAVYQALLFYQEEKSILLSPSQLVKKGQ